ncbi:NTF2 fold immunity protein [Pseudomonas lundensis]|uniref:NTF2 fold immunity protein n=1 Tax=Pseudomonas lundensis TaxID=86185 RepID=UPI00385B6179
MSPAERVQTFINQMVVWEAGFHAAKKSDQYKHNTEYRCRADADAKARLLEIFSENLSAKSLNTIGAARLETLGTGRPSEYDQAVLIDSVNSSGAAWTVETKKKKGISQRYQYILNVEGGIPKIDGVNVWRNSEEKWERRKAI